MGFCLADDTIKKTIDMVNEEFPVADSPAKTVSPVFDATPGAASGAPVFDDTPLPVRPDVGAGK